MTMKVEIFVAVLIALAVSATTVIVPIMFQQPKIRPPQHDLGGVTVMPGPNRIRTIPMSPDFAPLTAAPKQDQPITPKSVQSVPVIPAPPAPVPPPVAPTPPAPEAQEEVVERHYYPRVKSDHEDICERHHLHKVYTKGGRSWRCR